VALRDTGGVPDVLMVRRGGNAGFMPGAHVFPGGSVDSIDEGEEARAAVAWDGPPDELPWRAAALRELAEETGIALSDGPVELVGLHGLSVYQAVAAAGSSLDASRLHYLSNWVTPVGLARRFDTRFYVAVVSAETAVVADETEVFDAVWVEAGTALARGDAGEWNIEVPTRWHLELLAGLGSVEAIVAHAASTDPERVEPRIGVRDGDVVVLMPGDPGYAEADSAG
jgi:recombination protein RecT